MKHLWKISSMFTLVLCLTLSGCAVSENDVPAGENVSSQVQDSSVLDRKIVVIQLKNKMSLIQIW